jgi:hypothetical protein
MKLAGDGHRAFPKGAVPSPSLCTPTDFILLSLAAYLKEHFTMVTILLERWQSFLDPCI